jgi:hypothetical protein
MAKGVAAAPAHPTLPIARRAVRIDPPNVKTADCPNIVGCDDSCDYAIKNAVANPLVPHAEWFCTHLAELVGIACPDCQIIQMPDGSLVFGSRWEGGILANHPTTMIPPTWVQMVHGGAIPIAGLRPALSRIYAFDHFVHNIDRHSWNFLVRQNQNRWALLAFDYSRAWTYHGFPLPALPFNVADPNERTVRTQRALSLAFGGCYIDADDAVNTLETIQRVPKYRVKTIIKSHPKEWLPKPTRDAILSWWKSTEMTARIGSGKASGSSSMVPSRRALRASQIRS